MPVDVTFHPLDEALVSKFYIRGLEDGMGVVDLDTPSKVVYKKKWMNLIAEYFKKDSQAALSGKQNINADVVLNCRPYFITTAETVEVVNVLKLLDQAQTPDEVFDILHRQAEHADFNFAGAKAQGKAGVMQQVAAMPNLGQVQIQMYDWLDKKVYRYAMSRFVGLFSGMKINKFRPKRLNQQEEQFFKAESKRKPEDISADFGAGLGMDVATIMGSMYPCWFSRQLGLTDLKAWADHLFPTIEAPNYLFQELMTYNLMEPQIPKRVKTGSSGCVVRAQNIGPFRDMLRSGRDDIIKIFDRVGHYQDMSMTLLDRLTEVAEYSLQRGFGIIEASGVNPPY